MSAFTSTDDRHRALRLIGYRALDVITINGGAAGFLRNTEPEELSGLLFGVLEVFASVRLPLRPDLLTAGLVDLALTQIAEIDQSTDRRLAAELILPIRNAWTPLARTCSVITALTTSTAVSTRWTIWTATLKRLWRLWTSG